MNFFFFKYFCIDLNVCNADTPLPSPPHQNHLQNSTERVGGNTDSLLCL